MKSRVKPFPNPRTTSLPFLYLSWLYPETFWVYVGPAGDHGREEVWGYLIFSKDGHLISMAVHPQYRRRGVGKTLIEEAIDMFSLTKMWAEVRRSNHGALAFYRKAGFKIVGVIPNYYGDEDALIVQRPLSPPILHSEL